MKLFLKKVIPVFLIIVAVFSFTSHLDAAISLVQTKSGGSGAYTNTFTITPTGALVAGNTYFVEITAGNADSQPTVVDSLGNVYVMDLNTANPTMGERQSWLFRTNVTIAGTPTITVLYPSSFPDSAYIAREYSGLDTTSPLDKTSTNNDGTGFVQTHDAGTTAATTQASELIILFGGTSGSASPGFSAGSGYGNGLEQKGFDAFTYGFMSDKTISSTGAQSGNFTSSSFVRGQGGIATYKAAATPVTGAKSQMTLTNKATMTLTSGTMTIN